MFAYKCLFFDVENHSGNVKEKSLGSENMWSAPYKQQIC